MGLDVSILTNAWAHIRANPTIPVADQETYLATAMAQFVQSADIIYTTGLVAPSGGGPVTGPTASIAQIN